MRYLFGALLISGFCCSAGAQTLASSDVPKHLVIARELVDNLKPEDNHYSLGGTAVSFPGDIFSSGYAMKADCSGFLLAIFERAKYPTQGQMEFLVYGPKRKRPTAEDFVYSIEKEKGFTHILHVTDIKAGDLLAHAMLNVEDQRQTGTTGHVFLINSVPKSVAVRKPVVEGTRQFEVSIIDSNEEYVGADDSRIADPANKITGLGKGTIRLYADSNGELVGWARTFLSTNRFFSYSPKFPSDTKLRKAAIGRPIAGNATSDRAKSQ